MHYIHYTVNDNETFVFKVKDEEELRQFVEKIMTTVYKTVLALIVNADLRFIIS